MTRTQTILFANGDLGISEGDILSHFLAARPLWNLSFAQTSKEAMDSLDGEPPDAVVLDLDLPPGGPAGADVLLHIRRNLPCTPVILIAGTEDARLLRDTFLAETEADHLAGVELTPEGVLFREDLSRNRAFSEMEGLIASGLHRYGRVTNDAAVLVTHGTDTMAWGFAYLRYALRDLRANVAMTGSQVPLGGYFTESDALGNLRTAAFLLNRLRPARLFAVFNDGRSVFSGRLTKYRKWGEDAFDGRVIASGASGEVRPLRKDWVYIPYTDQRLGHLHLIRTGGTIESQRDSGEAGGLKPTGDFVWKYLTGSLREFFEEAHRHDLFALDSSNMSFEEWAQIALAIEAIGVARADTRFDPTVKPVFCNPLFTSEDYRTQFAACGRGSVLAGYGGGNANVHAASSRSVLPAIREAVRAGTFVAVTPQVPLEEYDAEYESGLALLEAGGIPCGDLPLADAQVKLSYLLGHADILETAASEAGLDSHHLLAAAFLSGVSMRRTGRLGGLRLAGGHSIPLHVMPRDPFATQTFEDAIRAVVAAVAV